MKSYFSLRRTIIICIWMLTWQLISLAVDNSIVFVGPLSVLHTLSARICTASFWETIFYSFIRISLGFITACVLGSLTGALSFVFPLMQEILEPVVLLIKSVPAASFIIIALIWMGSENLSVFISFLIVFPVLYINMLTGLKSTDKNLLEMADIFHISFPGKLLYIYFPALFPYFLSACNIALGMSWKSGIAAEVIGIPSGSIGEQLYMSKIYLNTADLFAWTFVIISVSALFEKIFLKLLVCLAVHFRISDV